MDKGVQISKKVMLINSASSFGTRLINVFVLLWLNQYLVSQLSDEEYSLLPLLTSVMMFAPLLTTVLTAGLGRYIMEAYARDDENRVTQIVSTMLPILSLAGVAFLSAGWIFAWYIDYVLTIAPERVWDARIMMGLLMMATAIRVPQSAFGVGLYIQQRFVIQNAIQVGCEFIRIALLFILLFGVSTRVMWVVTASVIAEMVSLVLITILSVRSVKALRFHRSAINWSIAGELTSFGGWSFVATLADRIRTGADPILLNKLATANDVACFHLGSLPNRQIQRFSQAVRQPLQPVLTALHATEDVKRLRNVYMRGGRIALWCALLPAVLLMVLHMEFILLYVGEEFAQAGRVMLISLTLFPLAYGSTLTAAIATAQGKIRRWALILVGMNSANLAVTIYLVGYLEWGAIGSALGTLATTAVFYPLFVYPLGLELVGATFSRWLHETLIPGFAPGVVTAAALLLINGSFIIDTWPRLLAAFTAGGTVYAVVLAFCFQKEDWADVRRVWDKVSGLVGRQAA